MRDRARCRRPNCWRGRDVQSVERDGVVVDLCRYCRKHWLGVSS